MQVIVSWRYEYYDTQISKLKITVHKIIQFILELPQYTSSDSIYRDLNVLNFDNLLKKNVY